MNTQTNPNPFTVDNFTTDNLKTFWLNYEMCENLICKGPDLLEKDDVFIIKNMIDELQRTQSWIMLSNLLSLAHFNEIKSEVLFDKSLENTIRVQLEQLSKEVDAK